MARLFRVMFKNLFFADRRALFHHKEPDEILEEGSGIKLGKTLKDLQKEEKRKISPAKPEEGPKELGSSPAPHLTFFGHLSVLLKKTAYSILKVIVASSLRITVEGKENIPRVNEALIVANHSSYLDVPIIAFAFYDNLINTSWVVSQANYNMWFLKWVYWLFRPIVTGGGTIDKIKDSLKDNRWVIIFPEGNERWCPPSEAAKKREKPSSGAAVIALSTGVTVIPVGITGADKVLPTRSFRLDTRYYITVKIGKSFQYKEREGGTITPELLKQTREEIMNRVYSLVYYS